MSVMAPRRPFVAFVLAFAVSLAGAVCCRAEIGKWEIGIAPSYAFPTHLTGDYMKKSFNFQTVATYQFHEWFAGGVELGYAMGHNLGGKITEVDWDNPPDGRPDNVKFESSAKAYWLNFTPVLKIGKWVEFEEFLYKPYIALGMGFYHVFYKDGTDKLTGYTTKPAFLSEVHVHPNTSSSDFNYGLNLGVGLDQQVFEFLHVGIDMRFHHIFNVADFDRDFDKDDDFDFLVPGLRISYVF